MNLTTINVDHQPFHYRADSAGDRGVIHQIFQSRDYDLDAHGEQSKRLRKWERNQKERLLVVDAGANIGASAVWFRTQVPCSDVIAIEPELNNFDLLQRNTAHLTKVWCVPGALASHSGYGRLIDPGRGDWGFMIGPIPTNHVIGNADEPVVQLYTMSDIMAMTQAKPYICKIDIEGGEEDLFAAFNDWLDLFALVIIELHDWMLVGRSTSRSFLRAISRRDFDVTLRGENLWCWSNSHLRE